jgi:hypothetical protein
LIRVLLAATSGMGLGIAIAIRFADTLRAPLPVSAESTPGTGIESLLVALPPGGATLLGAVAGALVGLALSRAGLCRVLPPFLVPGLSALVFVPGVIAWFPALAVLHGSLLDAVLIGAFGVAIWRYWEGRKSGAEAAVYDVDRETSRAPFRFRFPIRFRPGLLALGAFCIYVALGLRLMRDVGLSGDEPHYLLIAESLLRDLDLRVDNNYFEEHYTRFYRGKIGPHLAADSPYSVHGIGLPLLLLPGFALFGLTGVIVTEAALSGLVIASVFRLASRVAEEKALLATLAFAFTAPVLFLAVSTYPELPTTLVVVNVLLALSGPLAPERAKAFALGAASAVLPFFHVKFTPLAALLVSLLLFRTWKLRERPAAIACLAGAVFVGLLWLSFLAVTFGSIDPTASYGRPRVFLGSIPVGVMGLLFDQEFGLLPASPFYALGLSGLLVLVRRDRDRDRDRFLGIAGTLIVLTVLLPGAAHPLWTGGNSPPARFLLPALPVLAVACAALLRESRGRIGLAPWTATIIVTSFVVAGAMVFMEGQPLYLNSRDGSGRVWEALSSGWNVSAYLPSIVSFDARSLVIAAALGLLVTAALVLHGLRRAVRLPPLASIALAGSLVLDHTLDRPAPPEPLERRWVTTALAKMHDSRARRFVLLPTGETLPTEDALGRLPVPLAQQPDDGDPRYWWSLRYRIPAGEYAIDGISPGGTAMCNGGGCFTGERAGFETEVGLEAFRLRAQRLMQPPVLRLTRAKSTTAWSRQSVPLADHREGDETRVAMRLHALDDGVFLDRSGFWVKGGVTATFAVEFAGGRTRTNADEIEISNGGLANRVRVSSSGRTSNFTMVPWERKRYRVGRGEANPVWVTISSEGGFRPNALDPSISDGRYLGVLVHSAPFDLPP